MLDVVSPEWSLYRLSAGVSASAAGEMVIEDFSIAVLHPSPKNIYFSLHSRTMIDSVSNLCSNFATLYFTTSRPNAKVSFGIEYLQGKTELSCIYSLLREFSSVNIDVCS